MWPIVFRESAQRERVSVIAAIYARKSTDQNVPDAEKSVTRQIQHATAYAHQRYGQGPRRAGGAAAGIADR
jgi:hypothetical protein